VTSPENRPFVIKTVKIRSLVVAGHNGQICHILFFPLQFYLCRDLEKQISHWAHAILYAFYAFQTKLEFWEKITKFPEFPNFFKILCRKLIEMLKNNILPRYVFVLEQYREKSNDCKQRQNICPVI